MSQPTAHHVGITVEDLESMVEFYRDVVGLDVAARFEASGEAFATAVDVEGASARFAHFDAAGCRLELVEYDPVGETRDDGALNQPGATHVGLEVDDVEAFFEELPDDVTTLSEPQTTSTGSTIGFLRDPEGNLVEILNPS